MEKEMSDTRGCSGRKYGRRFCVAHDKSLLVEKCVVQVNVNVRDVERGITIPL